jgi:hypothetical protein
VRIFKAGAVTMVWNALYSYAMNSGIRYFFQVNDDLHFIDQGWPEQLVADIDQMNGSGVTGPNDIKFQCNLLTQAFVGRGHWEAFGFLFPPEIRNWMCDNWINGLYNRLEMRQCRKQLKAINGYSRKPYPRYRPCKNFDYHPLMHGHLKTFLGRRQTR